MAPRRVLRIAGQTVRCSDVARALGKAKRMSGRPGLRARADSSTVRGAGTPARCFRMLTESIETIIRNRSRIQTRGDRAFTATFEVTAQADAGQRCVVELFGEIGPLSWSAP